MIENTFFDFVLHSDRVIRDYHREAGRLSLSLGIEQREDGPSDAFRHCFTSAAVARDFGPGFADLVGTFHEAVAVVMGLKKDKPEPSERTRMDYWNNAVGRYISKEAVISSTGNGPSDTKLAEQCKVALDKDILIANVEQKRTGKVFEDELRRLHEAESSLPSGVDKSREKAAPTAKAPLAPPNGQLRLYDRIDRVLDDSKRINLPASRTHDGYVA